jgi:hypothetical protein
MTPIEFLRALWPDAGIYCLATPRGNGAWKHWTYDTVEDAAAQAAKLGVTTDVYFAMHTLRAKQVPHATQPGKLQVRVQRNMVEARCFFWDIDVDANDPAKYASQYDALQALIGFTNVTKLPKPMIISSGGGLHIYWPLSAPIASLTWKNHALHLRQLAHHYGLKIDVMRTTDEASVLRVAGTFNRKDPLNPRPVDVMVPGKVQPVGVFLKALNDAVITAGVQPQQAPTFQPSTTGNLDVEYDGPTPTMKAVLASCPQMARLFTLQGKFSEPEWYRSVIGVGRFTSNGHRNIHRLSAGHPGYSAASCDAKIKQSENTQKGPSSCGSVASVSGVGDTLCIGCPHQGQVHGPIQAAQFKDPAPAPVVTELVGDVLVELVLPDPPAPFVRLKNGAGIAVVAKNADGNEESTIIYDHDLYPVRRITNAVLGVEQQVWRVVLPRGEVREFVLDSDALYDMRKFIVAIANQGIYPSKGHLSPLMEYMTAYIKALQKLVAADAQCNHLGWTPDMTGFILPDKVIEAGGVTKPVQLSTGATRASSGLSKRGTLAKQVELMEFYNHAEYVPKQAYLLAGLAAAIFEMTGHAGVIVNAAGESGASKSTTLYAAASCWGHPKGFTLNGTNDGATVKARNERITVLSNLPICFDEITHMPVKQAVDLAMSISQSESRLRLQTDGVERASTGGIKSTIMLTTANSSLHSVLSTDNAAGTAGSMRLVEIPFKETTVHEKYEADDFLFALMENHGHLAEPFMAYVLTHMAAVRTRVREVMRDIEQAASIRGHERFWSGYFAAILVTAEITKMLGLLRFEPAVVRQWALEVQIPFMRGVVTQEYSDPLAIVADYLEAFNGNIIVMRKSTNGNLGNVIRAPVHGSLLMHYDVDDGLMYVLKKGFKDYCTRSGANSTKIIDDLHQIKDGMRIVPQTHTRRVLGAGTELAKAQSWCFAINMSHPAVSGIVDLKVVPGGLVGGVSGSGSATLQSVS